MIPKARERLMQELNHCTQKRENCRIVLFIKDGEVDKVVKSHLIYDMNEFGG